MVQATPPKYADFRDRLTERVCHAPDVAIQEGTSRVILFNLAIETATSTQYFEQTGDSKANVDMTSAVGVTPALNGVENYPFFIPSYFWKL